MRKNKTSNKYALKLSVTAIGVGAAMGAMAFSTGSAGSAASQPSSLGSTASGLVTQITNTAQNVASQAGTAISGAVSTIQNAGQTNATTGATGTTGGSFTSGTQAAASGSVASTAVVPQYTQAQLDAAGCDAAIWAKMVSDYQRQSAEIAALDTEQLVRQVVKATPPISSMAGCFDQAANIINSATAIYTTITKLLTGGGLDSNQLLQYGKNLLTKYACSLVDSYIASTGISGTLNQVNNLPNQVLGQNIGINGPNGGVNANIGSILQGGGYQQGQGSSPGTVTGGQIGAAVQQVVPGLR